MGVLHGDEIDYVFGLPLNSTNGYTKREKDLARRIMKHYKLFSKTGRPVEESVPWPKYTSSNPQYFVWNGNDSVQLGTGPRATACAFWNELMPVLRERQDGGICEHELIKALRENGNTSSQHTFTPSCLTLMLCLLLVSLRLLPPAAPLIPLTH
ncbi:hypothetical protein Pmani_038376 [Petrolisthes manimaculis]|uniref:Carboxylesterase type B domain-containing protein n=1 Tax=Petrolisthes manimaculis TaxID=1843537 RepID=A0AAE1NEI5_9EUCA|nr:hypothetical protein Pmani_038376 [Petrolisthes manimaculis]